MWHKLVSLFQRYFSSSLEYRSELLVWFALSIIPTFILFLVWKSIIPEGGTVKGYQLGQILQYYLMAIFISEMTASHFEGERVEQIREGKIDLYMTRPLSYLIDIMMEDLAFKVMYFIISAPLFILIWFILSRVIVFAPLDLTWVTILQFLVLMVGTYAIHLSLGLLIVILGFWFEGAQGLEHFKWITLSILSGSMIPLALMPHWLNTMVNYLPFKYMYAVSIGVIQGFATFHWYDLLYLFGFVLVLQLIILTLWRRALKRYASAGG